MCRLTVILLVGLLFLLAACGGDDQSESTPEPKSAEDTATEVAEVEDIVEPDPGKTVFRTKCASCHHLTDQVAIGPGLVGLFDIETLPNGEPFSEEALRTFITEGGGAMRGVVVSRNDLGNLIPFLRDATAL